MAPHDTASSSTRAPTPANLAAPSMAPIDDLIEACIMGDAATVQRLLDASPSPATMADARRQRPLVTAAAWGHAPVVRLLLQAAPAAAMTAGLGGWLPLHLAAANGHEAVVRLLLETAPAAAAVKTLAGVTPVQRALQGGRITAARALLSYGPAVAVLAALAASSARALPLFPDFLLAPGRLPLSASEWALVPSPCPGLAAALPAALACSPDQAAQVVRRLSAAERAHLRAVALCLSRGGLPGVVAALVLAHAA